MNLKQLKEAYNKKDESLYGTEKIKDLLGILYHENSKLDEYTARTQGEAMGSFSDPYIIERSTKPHKRYYGLETHSFSDLNLETKGDPFFDLINNRRSLREFDKEYKVSLNELAHLLHFSYGITKKSPINEEGGYMGYRNVPSGGGLYPLEIYVCLFNSHMKEGLYHYDDLSNSMVLLKEGNHRKELSQIIKAEPWIDINSSSGVIFVSGMIERQALKYGERSYRFMLQESGFVSYLMSLIMERMGLGSCMAGAYIDQKVNNYLGLDGNYETVLNPIFFGKKINS